MITCDTHVDNCLKYKFPSSTQLCGIKSAEGLPSMQCSMVFLEAKRCSWHLISSIEAQTANKIRMENTDLSTHAVVHTEHREGH